MTGSAALLAENTARRSRGSIAGEKSLVRERRRPFLRRSSGSMEVSPGAARQHHSSGGYRPLHDGATIWSVWCVFADADRAGWASLPRIAAARALTPPTTCQAPTRPLPRAWRTGRPDAASQRRDCGSVAIGECVVSGRRSAACTSPTTRCDSATSCGPRHCDSWGETMDIREAWRVLRWGGVSPETSPTRILGAVDG